MVRQATLEGGEELSELVPRRREKGRAPLAGACLGCRVTKSSQCWWCKTRVRGERSAMGQRLQRVGECGTPWATIRTLASTLSETKNLQGGG